MDFQNVIMFSEQSKDLYESMKEFARETLNERKGVKAFEKHSKDEMKKLINKAFAAEVSRLSGQEIPTDKNSIARFSTRSTIVEFADETRNVMIDAILPDVLNESALRYIADIQTADFGDAIKFEIASNQLLTVSKAGNRQRNTNVQKTYKNDVTMTGENHMITVQTNLYDILIGRSYIADEIMKSALAIETALLFDTIDAFTASANELTGALAVANYSEESLIKLCETVGAYNEGRRPVIIGTPIALKKVLPTNGNYRYLLDSDYVKLGHVNTFNTYDVIPVEQMANPYDTTTDYALKLDDTKIYVVSPASDKIVKIGMFGGTMAHQNDALESGNLSVMHTISQAWDVQCITNSVCGVVKSLG